MSGFRAVQLFNLAVPCDGEPIPALAGVGFPASFRITMAAIDPTESLDNKSQANGTPSFIGSTLRMIRVAENEDDSDSDDSDSMDIADLLDGGSDSDDSDDEEINGGPSDPSKSPKAKRKAALLEALASANEDMDLDEEPHITAKDKGKGKAIDIDESDDSEDSEEDLESEPEGAEEFVLCTLDPAKVVKISSFFDQTLMSIAELSTNPRLYCQ